MRKVVVFAVCFMLAGVANVFAESLPRHSGELGAELSYIKYDEPGIMEEDGIMYGLSGAYAYHNNFMLKAEGKFSYGQVDYDGQLSTGASYTIDDIDDYMLEFRGLGGYDFPIFTATTLTPYIGFGYRYLNDDMSCDPAGYERESNYYYSPIGIETFTDLDNGWAFGLKIEYDYFWKGVQKSHLSDAVAALSDVENDQEDGYGIRGSVKVQKKTDRVDYLIEPFIRYWNIEESEDAAVSLSGTVIGTGVEPENDSIEIGVKFAVKF